MHLSRAILEADFHGTTFVKPHFGVYVEDEMWFHILTKFGFDFKRKKMERFVHCDQINHHECLQKVTL